MMISGLTLYILAAHAAGDYALQADWMAANKLDYAPTRAAHVTVYTACFIPVALLAGWGLLQAGVFLGLTWILHFIVDSRRWKEPTEQVPSLPILFDQAYHVICLAFTMFIVTVVM